jgi:TatD DNase family protein
VFADDLDGVVARAQTAGVRSALCIVSADEADEIARAARVREAWPEVRFAAGVHPHRAAFLAGRPADAPAAVSIACREVGALAIGEIGLDYHYDFAPREVQREVFAAQLALAGSLGLPVVIHSRKAMDDTAAILRQATPAVAGVMHCFTGTLDEAREALDLGLLVSLAGIVTFPRAGTLRDVAAFVPADRLLLETDAPFLAPVPYRGKRNEPAWVVQTLAAVAAIRSTTSEGLGEAVVSNFRRLVGQQR